MNLLKILSKYLKEIATISAAIMAIGAFVIWGSPWAWSSDVDALVLRVADNTENRLFDKRWRLKRELRQPRLSDKDRRDIEKRISNIDFQMEVIKARRKARQRR